MTEITAEYVSKMWLYSIDTVLSERESTILCIPRDNHGFGQVCIYVHFCTVIQQHLTFMGKGMRKGSSKCCPSSSFLQEGDACRLGSISS